MIFVTKGNHNTLFEKQLRNDTWSFESVRYNKGVTRSGKYAFDVLVKTKGIIQIGWVTPGYLFDPEAGLGVGDDEFSYSIDGQRAKKWHGLNPENVSQSLPEVYFFQG
jgi:hypothetical protein